MADQTPTSATSTKPRRGKMIRRVLKGLAALVVIVIGLVALAPTLLSTGMGKSVVLGIVNKKLNGRVDIADWSLGWFSGVKITGVKLSDPTGRQLASVDTISIPMPLWHALTGKYPIGEALIDGVSFDAVVGPDGILNFSKLAKPDTSPPSTPAAATPPPAGASSGFSIPPVFGRLTVNHVHGTFTRPNQPVVTVQSLNAVATLPENSGSVTGKLDAVVQTGNQPPTAIAIDLDQAIKRATVVDLGAGKLAATVEAAGDTGDSLAVALNTTPVAGGAVQFHLDKCDGDLIRLNKQFAFFPAGMTITNGSFDVAATGSFDPSTSTVSIAPLDARLNNLSVARTDAAGKPTLLVDHWTIKTHLEGSGSFSTVVAATIKNLTVADSQQIFSAGATGLSFTRSAAGVFSGPGGAVNIAADLPKLNALLTKFQSPPPGDATAPTTIDSGNLVATIKLTPEPTRLHVKLDGAIKQLIVAGPSGKTPVEEVPMSVDAAVSPDFSSIELAKATITSHAAAVSIENAAVALNAKTALEKFTKATIRVDVPDLKTAMAEADLFSKPSPPPPPAKPGEPATEPLKYDAGAISASIVLGRSGTAADIKLTVDGKNIAFHRGKVAETLEPFAANGHLLLTPLANDDCDVAITTLTAGLDSAKISIADGSIGHLMTTRDLKLSANLTYDLAKLFTEFKPMLGDSLQTMKIAGVAAKTFVVGGSYPAGKPFTEAIKTTTIDGGLAVDSLDYDGVKTDKPFEISFNLRKGILATNNLDNTAPAPIAANSGQIHVDHLLLDLTGDAIRLTTPANCVLVEHFTINPLFSGTILANFLNNPLFVGTEDATGLLYVTFKSCDRLPLGDLIKKTTPDNDGSLHAIVSIADLHLGIANDELKQVLKGNSIEGNVNGATMDVAHGLMTEHFPIGSSAYVISLDGSARLSDQNMTMALSIPLNWIAKTHLTKDKDILAAVPDSVAIKVTGKLDSPNFDGSPVIEALKNALAKGGKKAIEDKLLKGKKPEDAIGDLLNQLGKKKK